MGSTTDFQPTVFQFTPTTHHKPYPFISPAKQNLSSRSVFITGASKGIGRTTAVAFAAAGASRIAIGARTDLSPLVQELLEVAQRHGRHPPEILPLILDVTEPQSVDSAAQKLSQVFNGHLDILINNAGYLEPFVPVASSNPDNWWRSWEVNVRGPYLVSRSTLPLLLSKSEGLKTILNISSVGALRQRPGASGYQTAKFALLRFSEFLNAEYASQGLISYSAHPGGVMTELARNMPKETHHMLQDTPELGGETFVWLTSERREWLRGRYVSVNWDMEEFLAIKQRVEDGDLLKARVVV